MKCLPSNKLPLANGNILHDWHAEILALRAFNRFLLEECLAVLSNPSVPSEFLDYRFSPTEPFSAKGNGGSAGFEMEQEQRWEPPLKLKDGIELHMYCSEAPCGDASMELTMSAQEDATPWTSPLRTISSSTPATSSSNSTTDLPSRPGVDTAVEHTPPPDSALTIHHPSNPVAEKGKPAVLEALRGRSHFSHLGQLRLKPSRPDAPPTLSKSCTDKLTLIQATSMLSSLTSLLIHPGNCYLKSLVLPESQYVPEACERAFSPSGSGRLKGLTETMRESWGQESGYAFRPFEVRSTSREFRYSRRSVMGSQKSISCNLSAVWTPRFEESLIGGVLQGRKQMDPRGASLLSKRRMWGAVVQTLALMGAMGGSKVVDGLMEMGKYRDVKEIRALEDRRKVKRDVRGVLKGWVRNEGDDRFGLDEDVKENLESLRSE